MPISSQPRGAGRSRRRSTRTERYVRRMEEIADLVRATFLIWEALPQEFRQRFLRATDAAILVLVGLSSGIVPTILQVIR